MLKSYDYLRKIDVREYCDDRDGALYLPYNKCIDLLHENGAETAYFLPIPNPKTGVSLYESETAFEDKNGNLNRCYETRIEIHIDDKVYYMQSPVMNGANPVKDNSMSQQRVWNSMTRSFVKAVAMYTGLGFDLWLKEEDTERKQQAQADQYHDILKVRERVLEEFTALNKRGLSKKEIAKHLGMEEDELDMKFKMYAALATMEMKLIGLLRETNDKRS